MREENLLDTILTVGKDVTGLIIVTLEPIFGFYTEIFYPLSPKPNSVYGSDDNKYKYKQTPDEETRCIINNLFDEDFNLSDYTYDPFPSSQAYVLTAGSRVIPANSKLIIYKGQSQYKQRVVTHKVLNGNDGAIYIKNMLAPWS